MGVALFSFVLSNAEYTLWRAARLCGQYMPTTVRGAESGRCISTCDIYPAVSPGRAVAVAAVQPGYDNTGPLQLDMDPGLGKDADSIAKVAALIRSHFALGGTQINLNVLDKAQILEAHKDPSKYPDLVVRVTGFSAYFASLAPEFRQLVVDRIVAEG